MNKNIRSSLKKDSLNTPIIFSNRINQLCHKTCKFITSFQIVVSHFLFSRFLLFLCSWPCSDNGGCIVLVLRVCVRCLGGCCALAFFVFFSTLLPVLSFLYLAEDQHDRLQHLAEGQHAHTEVETYDSSNVG